MGSKKRRIRLVSWNVNGIRAAMKKGFLDSFRMMAPDVLAIQETKLQGDQVTEEMAVIDGYESYWAHASVKKGYSGVAVYTRIPALKVQTSIGYPEYDAEGRIIAMDFGEFVFFNVYFPNGQRSDERLRYKLDFYRAFFSHTDEYRRQGRSLVICGDFNTAHNEIDLKNPKANEHTSGFMRVERDWIDRMMADGYVDTFRRLYPDKRAYSWWTYRFNARARDIGWRIDCFFVTRDMFERNRINDAFIDPSIQGSDHCPVGLLLDL